ncbi:sodium channel protein Nach [Drosophila grimshawi]|uniref:GH22707 n=1 Tax=Drosophila grimshawi TaxID=7222 RepID=B4JWN2_DROGR|nr:sodium channel protein Nach [Drosophila grimshawi]EDV98370.1 GH22707 [Drosophila grimshawi]
MGHEEELSPEQINTKITPLRGALQRTWCDFCATSSIHGLKYIRDRDTNRIVHFVWILISVVMFACAIVMTQTFYADYRSSPTRMNVESDHTPVSKIYFPPITICPEVLFNMDKSRAFIETLKLPQSVQVADILGHLHIFSGFMLDDARFAPEEIELMESVLLTNNLTMVQFVHQLRWDCNEILHRCRYHGDIMDCSRLFQLSQTFFGHCCSFNLRQHGVNFTGQQAAGGMENGLSLILRYKDENYDSLKSYSHGFKLLIQETDAFPSAHANIKFLGLNTESFATLRVVETFCSEAVKALSIEERNCVFDHEFQLQYFADYVYPNCELNCRAMNMVKLCKCLTYFFEFNRTKDRVCTFRDIPCLVDNFPDIITRKKKSQCTCPLCCEHFDYDVQVSNFALTLNMPVVDAFYDGIEDKDAIVHIFVNSQVYRRVRVDLLTNMVTLVSNLGSAFSLFVGMSMLSLVEIIYYFTVILRRNYVQECRARQKLFASHRRPNVAWTVAENSLPAKSVFYISGRN